MTVKFFIGLATAQFHKTFFRFKLRLFLTQIQTKFQEFTQKSTLFGPKKFIVLDKNQHNSYTSLQILCF
jgi:hypothetical protein